MCDEFFVTHVKSQMVQKLGPKIQMLLVQSRKKKTNLCNVLGVFGVFARISFDKNDQKWS